MFLLVGIRLPVVVSPTAATIAILMVGTLGTHAKVGDPLIKSLPAILMLLMDVAIVLLPEPGFTSRPFPDLL